MRLSGRVNGVSRRHGQVSRNLWRDLWPDRPWEAVPIGHVTNGVHLATWMASPIMALLDEHLGPRLGRPAGRPGALGPGAHPRSRQALGRPTSSSSGALANFMREDARRRFAGQLKEAAQVVGAGTLLDPMALTIGFARRFATYKRANLIFRDLERLRRLLVDPWRPVQIIFAGKAHPADNPGKEVLQSVYQFTRDPEFEGRVAFLEDYDMHLAHLLVQGVDLWLNLPRVPLEASGTSGMKAALNGVPQLSTLDGWWQEGYDGLSGWAISPAGETEDADAADAEQLLPAAGGAGRSALLHPQRARRSARLGGEDAARAPAGRAAASPPGGWCEDYVQEYYAPAIRGDERLATIHPRHEADRCAPRAGRAGRPAAPLTPRRPAGLRRPRHGRVLPLCPHRRPGRSGERPGQLPARRRVQRRRHPAALPHGARRRARPRAGGAAVPGSDGAAQRGGAGLPRGAGHRAGPQVFFIEHLDYFNRPGIYGENAVDYPDNARRFAFFALAAVTALPRLVPGPVLLHAHDWHTALALVYLRTVLPSERFAATALDRALGAQSRLSGTLPARGDARDRSPLGAVQLASAGVVRQGQLSQGRARLRRFRHHGEPHPGRGAPHAGRRFRPA